MATTSGRSLPPEELELLDDELELEELDELELDDVELLEVDELLEELEDEPEPPQPINATDANAGRIQQGI